MSKLVMTVTSRFERGQALVLVAIATVVLLGMASLAIDYGCVTAWKDELRRAADAAALAGAARMGSGQEIATATSFAAKNSAAGKSVTLGSGDAELGAYDFTSGLFSPSAPPANQNAIHVTARRTASAPDGALPVFFASVLGITSAEVTVESLAAVDRRLSGIAGGEGNLVPFLVNATTLGGIDGGGFHAAIGSQIDFYPQRGDAPGNFGLANLDGGPNGVPELVEWITNGYPDPVTIPNPPGYLMVEGSPGFKAGTGSAVESRIGDTVVVLVYDQVTGEGSNAQFRVRTFCAVGISAVRMTGKMSSRYIRGTVQSITSSAAITSSGGMNNDSIALLRLVQ